MAEIDLSQVKGDDGLTDDERRRAKFGLDTEIETPAARKRRLAGRKTEPEPEA